MKPSYIDKWGNKTAKVNIPIHINGTQIISLIAYIRHCEKSLDNAETISSKSEWTKKIKGYIRAYGMSFGDFNDDWEVNDDDVSKANQLFPEFF
jgi:hypothetical protein